MKEQMTAAEARKASTTVLPRVDSAKTRREHVSVVPETNGGQRSARRHIRPVEGFGPPVPRQRPPAPEERRRVGCKGPEAERKELRQRLEESRSLVGTLQSEVKELRSKLEKLQVRNDELEEQNKKMTDAAEKIESSIHSASQTKFIAAEVRQSEYGGTRMLVADKLENAGSERKLIGDSRIPKVPQPRSQSLGSVTELNPEVSTSTLPPPLLPLHSSSKRSSTCGPPPPPPPPPPRCTPTRAATMQKAPSLVEFYHSLTKRDRDNCSSGLVSCGRSVVNKAHSGIVGEIQNRSAHLLAIKADVENKGEFIKSLIAKVQTAAFSDIEDVSVFVEWLDKELSTLADERAVLKHFNWPERKADAMREVAFEYRALKHLEVQVNLFEDDTTMTFEAALKKMANLLDKSERSIQRLTKLRDGTIGSYGSYKIPTEWMLDSGMVSKIKNATVRLAKICLKRVAMELESIRHLGKELIQETLLLQCVRFAFRVHQFAGGFDMETMSAFEELRQRRS